MLHANINPTHIVGVEISPDQVEERRTASPAVYTCPESITWEGKAYKVPAVLATGNHAKIEEWKKSKKKS